MREGPLADLFRSTVDDPPVDPPEAPTPGESRASEQADSVPSSSKPRYGREDPVAPHDETPQPGPPSPAPDPAPPPGPSTPEPEPPSPEPEPPPPQMRERDPEISTLPEPKERLQRIFADSGDPDLVKAPRWGREEPQYLSLIHI